MGQGDWCGGGEGGVGFDAASVAEQLDVLHRVVFAIACPKRAVMGFGGGYWLDLRFGTKPWLTFLGFFLGVAAGVLNVYRVMKLSDAADKENHPRQ